METKKQGRPPSIIRRDIMSISLIPEIIQILRNLKASQNQDHNVTVETAVAAMYGNGAKKMIEIYYPRLNPITLKDVIPAEMRTSSRTGLTNQQCRELAEDINKALDFIESLPVDLETYKAKQKDVEKAVDDFNRAMYEKWG